MIDWILAGALRAHVEAAHQHASHARVVLEAELTAQQAASDLDQVQQAENAARDERRSSDVEARELAMQSLPLVVSGVPMLVRVQAPVWIPEGTRAELQAQQQTQGHGRGTRPHSMFESGATPQDSFDPGSGLVGQGASQAGGFQPGVTITPYVEQSGGHTVRFYELVMSSSSFFEKFLLYVPHKPPAGATSAATPAPLVVFFHGFGHTHWDVWAHTEFIQECQRRGWYLVSPLGATNMSFASPLATANREVVLDWMRAVFPRIDHERVYGVGFSMGGGAVTNYAARHLDPEHFRFAALINHTGGVDLNHTYALDPTSHLALDFWYGDGTPLSADPWLMARSSILRIDPITLDVQQGWDLARNLLQTPMRTLRATNEPIDYLATQNDVLHGHMYALGVQPGVYGYYLLPSDEHTWSLLDPGGALDYLGAFRLTVPSAANLLADGDRTYHHFAVEQDVGGAFSPFSYAIDVGANELVLDRTANIRRVVVDSLGAGLDPLGELAVELEAADGQPDEVVLRGFEQAPLAVLRDGLAEVSWAFDAQRGELLLREYDGARHRWLIQP